jgi:hypothetical protein
LDSYKYHRCALRPRLSHRSLDRHPNDYLGRSCFRPQLFEHRRQILRDCAEPDTDANSYGYTDTHCNGNTDGNSNGHSDSYRSRDSYLNIDSDSNGDSDSYGNCDGDSTFNSDAYANRVTKSYSYAEVCTDTAAAPDPGAAPIAEE